MKITVVTPSFNQGDFLEETILSVLNQRYPNLEYIVIDDGSTDGSLEITKKYADRLAHWETGPNQGQTRAINKGLRRATGDILCYLNSDDVLLPGSLHRAANEMLRDPSCRWLTGQFVFFGSELANNMHLPVTVPRYAGQWFGRDPICQPSTFWRREVTERHGLFDESYRYGMDYEYWVRLIVGGEQCNFVNFPFSGYRLHSSSKTVAQAERFKAEDQRIRDTYIPRLSAADRRRAYRAIRFEASKPHYTEARDLITQGRKIAALRRLAQVVWEYPSTASTKWCLGTIRRLLYTPQST